MRDLAITMGILLGASHFAESAVAQAARGPSPMIVMARAKANGDKVQLFLMLSDVRPEERTRSVTVGGKQVTQVETVMVVETRTLSVRLKGDAKASVMDIKGDTVDLNELPRRLKTPTPVLVCFGERVDPAYLKIVKRDTLVIAIKQGVPRLAPVQN